MKDLSQILPRYTNFKVVGDVQQQIVGFNFDSRIVRPGEIFVAKKGSSTDGHRFIPQVLEVGIRVILCEQIPDLNNSEVCIIQTEHLMEALSEMLNAFYENPSDKLQLVGITGTNGKTTVATLCYQLFESLGYKTGLISTVENRMPGKFIPATHTTPDMISLYALLSEMVSKSCAYVFMEVSSHAIDQNRILGLNYRIGVFTNITQDHLDYHGTFLNYIHAKKKFFDGLTKKSTSLVNADDPNASVMLQNTKSERKTFGVRNMADYKLRILQNGFDGLHLKYMQKEWFSGLAGTFNASNLAAVLAIALELGEDLDKVLTAMSALHPVSGRFEWIKNPSSGKIGIIDYAHTPDAVEKILTNIRDLKKTQQRIITVLGCGGNRDKSKRPMMAAIAVKLSDLLILTSDNPRDEDPMDIIHEMQNGIHVTDHAKFIIQLDREQAIKTACVMAGDHDIVLVAGKGHETYQEIKGIKYDFDDLKILKTYLLKI